MAFSGNFMCTRFKKELLEAVHNFKNSGGSTFKLALYDNNIGQSKGTRQALAVAMARFSSLLEFVDSKVGRAELHPLVAFEDKKEALALDALIGLTAD